MRIKVFVIQNLMSQIWNVSTNLNQNYIKNKFINLIKYITTIILSVCFKM